MASWAFSLRVWCCEFNLSDCLSTLRCSSPRSSSWPGLSRPLSLARSVRKTRRQAGSLSLTWWPACGEASSCEALEREARSPPFSSADRSVRSRAFLPRYGTATLAETASSPVWMSLSPTCSGASKKQRSSFQDSRSYTTTRGRFESSMLVVREAPHARTFDRV